MENENNLQAIKIEKLFNYARSVYLAFGVGVLWKSYHVSMTVDVYICFIIALLLAVYRIFSSHKVGMIKPGLYDYFTVIIDLFLITSLMVEIHDEHRYFFGMLYLSPITGYGMRFGKSFGIKLATVSACLVLVVEYKFGSGQYLINLLLVLMFLVNGWLWGEMSSGNQRIINEISQLVILDDLTGAYNVRFFRQSLLKELELAKISKTPLALMMLDIDYFKNYNDTLGHPAGDKLLKEFCELVKTHIRECDVLARYGGEEFAIILPDTGADRALIVAERIREKISNYPFKGKEVQPHGVVSTSLGIAVFPYHGTDLVSMVESADQALYLSKRQRNKVELYEKALKEEEKAISSNGKMVGGFDH